MKTNKIIKITNLILLFFAFSCEEFVSIDVPDTQLSGEQVFNDVRTAESVLTHVYTKLHNSVVVTGDSGGITVLLGNYADELTCYNANLPELVFNENQLLESTTTIHNFWRDTYHLIYVLNTVIEGVGNSTTIVEADRDRLIGEALFVRAYLHFYLNQLFGEVPYVKSTDYRLNTTISKESSSTIYSFIEQDLISAESLLVDTYTGDYRVRPNRSAVVAMQARLYLYHGEWELARQKATAVIENTGLYQWVEDLNSVFLRNSTGTIWQLMSSPEGKNTLEAKSFVFTLVPPPNRALAQDFITQFETGDLRAIDWVKSVTNGMETYYHPFKYKLNVDTSTSMEYPIQFRLEEMYLIRAEAYAELGFFDLSKMDINKIRNRAGLGTTAAQTKNELITAILKERKFEFFCELGHRFFDLKRRGLLDTTLSNVKPGWNSTDVLFPLPENELLLNSNLLPQNPGY
ncbi:RagB/SusD family nutrient uptake outer membrane protein [Flavobacterium orientale]|uniref:Membrane protein n=1 Tax=Flavobacterium orientale TaxID=1756020 RepID=A0A916Y8M0_9FLAO|nr:RagB/SusD family nutrient uptake outer membrane protein [Flavobacterium orientale]GGD35330.1 membrane protein [Flavobacterium orientale]